MVRNLASEYGVDKKWRIFSVWCHVVCLLYAQLTHSIGMNDICDALRHHRSKLFVIRGATPPSRNGLLHANRTREGDMMEALLWKMLDHLQNRFLRFGPASRYQGLPHRFKKAVYNINSSTISLMANLHGLGEAPQASSGGQVAFTAPLHSCLPSVAVIEEGYHRDRSRMIALCIVGGDTGWRSRYLRQRLRAF